MTILCKCEIESGLGIHRVIYFNFEKCLYNNYLYSYRHYTGMRQQFNFSVCKSQKTSHKKNQ
jgi:hypothetical protein